MPFRIEKPGWVYRIKENLLTWFWNTVIKLTPSRFFKITPRGYGGVYFDCCTNCHSEKVFIQTAPRLHGRLVFCYECASNKDVLNKFKKYISVDSVYEVTSHEELVSKK